MQLRYGRYVGRVGALAVALGIGSAVAFPAGIGWADPDDSGDTSTSSNTETTSGTESQTTAPETDPADATGAPTTVEPDDPESVEPETGSSTTQEVAPGVTVSSSGGALTSGGNDETDEFETEGAEADEDADLDAGARSHTSAAVTTEGAETSATSTVSGQTVEIESDDTEPQVADDPAPAAADEVTTFSTFSTFVEDVDVAESQPAPTVVSAVLNTFVTPVLSLFGVGPGGPAESPLAWLFLGAARREIGVATEEMSLATAAAPMTVAALAVNEPPTATITWGRPDATTGTVVGQLVTNDPEGKTVAVSLTSAPSAGSYTYNSKTKVVTYTPTTAQRFVAATTATPDDTIGMTITISDGVNQVVVPIDIPVSAAPFYKKGDLTDAADVTAVAATSTRAFVTNKTAGTVTVYDTVNNTVVATYQAGAAPDGIVVKPNGTRLYVSSSTNNTVTVIDASTGAIKKTLNVANPTAIAINPSGSTVYVANGNAGTITKINTAYNSISSSVVKLPAGYRPTELTVSPDGKKIYVASTKTTGGGNISVFTSSATTAVSITDTTGAPTGLVISPKFPRLYASADDGVVTIVDTSNNNAIVRNIGLPLNGIAITNDSSAVMITNASGLVAAINALDGTTLGVTRVRDAALPPMSVQPSVLVSPDGTQMFVTDYDTDTVHIVSLVPPNLNPFSSDPYYTVSNPAKGTLSGKVGVVDFDGDPLTYTVTAKPKKGTLVLKADGTYTYTPTATARHAASVTGAPSSVTTDSFTVSVSDGRNGVVTQTITVDIAPANKVPVVTTTVGAPSSTTGVVKGSVKASDGDYDKKTFTVTGAPTKGTVTLTSTGSFTYTPTAEARAAATAPGAPYDATKDTFVVTVDDGHGGVVPVTVNVRIGPKNVAPKGASATVIGTDPRSGVISGTVTATDANGDPLSYTASATKKGAIEIGPDGSFTYTPTAAARAAASGGGWTSKTETVTFTITDGFGGKTTKSLKLTIAPNPTTNAAPTNGHVVPGSTETSTAIGTVTGVVTATDPNGDKLTYSLASGPAFGKVTVTSDGKFTYTPDVDARYRALVMPQVDQDTFTVKISDDFGGTTTATVNVEIVPPSASAVDQRPTTVAVTAQQMFFYSQTDTDTAMALLKDAGIDTIRILIPWAGVEPTDDAYNWAAVDRMVNSAYANDIKVLAVLNSTPDWVAVPGQPPLAGYPTDLEAFEEYVTAVATRYEGKVADYEIWNEPNAKIFWSPAPNAAQYTELLKVAYTAIKAADPNATVIAASVASAAEVPGGPTINPVTYVSQMYAAGAGGYFDAIAYHPYLYALPFSAGEGHAGVPFTQAQQIYEVMVANGDGHKKIWATEYGQPSSEFSEDNQAAYVGDFLRTWRTLEYAGPAFIHTLADYPSSDPIQASFGLFHEDWTPKPVLAVVEQVIAENEAIESDNDVV